MTTQTGHIPRPPPSSWSPSMGSWTGLSPTLPQALSSVKPPGCPSAMWGAARCSGGVRELATANLVLFCISLESSSLKGTWASPPRKHSLCRTGSPSLTRPIDSRCQSDPCSDQGLHRPPKNPPEGSFANLCTQWDCGETTRGWTHPKDMLLPCKAGSPGLRGYRWVN